MCLPNALKNCSPQTNIKLVVMLDYKRLMEHCTETEDLLQSLHFVLTQQWQLYWSCLICCSRASLPTWKNIVVNRLMAVWNSSTAMSMEGNIIEMDAVDNGASRTLVYNLLDKMPGICLKQLYPQCFVLDELPVNRSEPHQHFLQTKKSFVVVGVVVVLARLICLNPKEISTWIEFGIYMAVGLFLIALFHDTNKFLSLFVDAATDSIRSMFHRQETRADMLVSSLNNIFLSTNDVMQLLPNALQIHNQTQVEVQATLDKIGLLACQLCKSSEELTDQGNELINDFQKEMITTSSSINNLIKTTSSELQQNGKVGRNGVENIVQQLKQMAKHSSQFLDKTGNAAEGLAYQGGRFLNRTGTSVEEVALHSSQFLDRTGNAAEGLAYQGGRFLNRTGSSIENTGEDLSTLQMMESFDRN
uniref:Uncharacterized protein n=1 Tax=Ditylenchus dipsaci TaxID=166011 RepID=A0A915DAH2_9BILA